MIVVGSARSNVETIGRLVLRAGASLEGDVKATGVVIEDGAISRAGRHRLAAVVPTAGN